MALHKICNLIFIEIVIFILHNTLNYIIVDFYIIIIKYWIYIFSSVCVYFMKYVGTGIKDLKFVKSKKH